MIIRRYLEEKIILLLTQFPIVAVIGPRQCGKTTLCKKIGLNWKWVDLERESDYTVISRDPELFLQKNSAHVVFDEIQLLPELFSALRVCVDEERIRKGRFLITGSSSAELSKNVSESLAGRVDRAHSKRVF